jgi:hypothetical protein
MTRTVTTIMSPLSLTVLLSSDPLCDQEPFTNQDFQPAISNDSDWFLYLAVMAVNAVRFLRQTPPASATAIDFGFLEGD